MRVDLFFFSYYYCSYCFSSSPLSLPLPLHSAFLLFHNVKCAPTASELTSMTSICVWLGLVFVCVILHHSRLFPSFFFFGTVEFECT